MTDSSTSARDIRSDGAAPPGLTLTHLNPTIGTEITGLDLSQPLAPALAAYLRKLWLDRKVLFFRNQNITREQHVRLGRCFGELQIYSTGSEVPEYPELLVFERGRKGEQGSENFWHYDAGTNVCPVAGCIGLMKEMPTVGGDTLFADMTAAYDGLSPWMKDMLAPLRAVNSIERFRSRYALYNAETYASTARAFPPTVMRLVQTHPETGRKVLYASRMWTTHILDLGQDESDAVLQLLFSRAQVP